MFREFFIDGKKVKDLYINGKKVKTKPSEFWGLTFTAEEPNSTVKIQAKGSAPVVNLKTSIDNGTTWTSYTVGDTITLANIGDNVCFVADGSNAQMASSVSDYNNFVFSGKISSSGNVNSLLNDDEKTARTLSLSAYACFLGLFLDCSSLIKAPELPATTLAESCYDSMFQGCTSLTSAPELPATTLANYCYAYMFNGCTSLISAPELPATTLANYCYNYMFSECTSLISAPELPATTLAEMCYAYMFNECTSLISAPELPATTLASSCYDSMFEGCTSLTSTPKLPATTLAEMCYNYMFYSCSKLKSIEINFTTWNPSSATSGWLDKCSPTGKFKCPTALGSDETITRGSNNCPNNWVVYHGTDQLSNCAIRYTKDYVETGSEIRPDVQVYSDIDGELMTEGTGYTVSYSDNILPGTGHITITGLGDFAGQTVIKDFTIAPATIESCTFEYSKVNKYTGSSIEPNVTVKNLEGNTLTRNTDYTVSYQDNTDIGTGKIVITGAGLYTGSKTLDFLIVSADDSKTTLWRNNTEPEATDYDVSGLMNTSNTGRSGWFNNDNAITKIQIGLGVTDVDEWYFFNTKALTEIDLTKFTNPNIICTSQATSSSKFASNIQNIYVANSEMETAFKAAKGWSYVADKISVKP